MSVQTSTVTANKPNWFIRTINSSIGRKIIMGLTGLFLILFLIVHLAGNLQLLFGDQGESFNKYAYFMGHNEVIQIVSILNFGFIFLHILFSMFLAANNAKARPVKYAYEKRSAKGSWSSRNMLLLGTIVLIFLVVHLQGLWWKSKFGPIPTVSYDGTEYHDLYAVTKAAFSQLWLVILYVISMAALAFHLVHGFQSAFQTMGMRHRKYTPLIKTVGVIFSILVPVGFAAIPVIMYLQSL
ncbi:MAG: succinate dehydrogenase cytochrome b subunit [Bacteroidia bacterium]|nr:succinate dehydrogenase cytochrome b subunit [Bacteroidia bacterium]